MLYCSSAHVYDGGILKTDPVYYIGLKFTSDFIGSALVYKKRLRYGTTLCTCTTKQY